MSATAPLLSRLSPRRPNLSIRYDRHQMIGAREGDTVSAALMGAGILETSRSIKLRRPRGAYCLRGDCGTCLVRIDGVPNLRACQIPVRDGMQVLSQNRIAPVGPDPTALVDKVFAQGMDHHHFMVRPKLANVVMQGVARNLAGLGVIPDRAPEPSALRRRVVRVLVVGAGPAGQAAADVLRVAGVEHLLVDRRDDAAGGLASTGVFGAYAGDRTWAAMTQRGREPSVLNLIEADAVIVATGCREPMLPIEANDVPGVVAAQGLLGQLRRSEAELAAPCVVVGEAKWARLAADALRPALVLEPAQVETVLGGHAVEGVRHSGGKTDCSLVALAPAPAPAFELAKQGGAHVRWDGGGFAVQRDEHGRCASVGPWSLWAAGDVCGYIGPDAAGDDGRRVARALIERGLT